MTVIHKMHYGLKCDHCKVMFSEEFDYYDIDESGVVDYATENEWVVVEGSGQWVECVKDGATRTLGKLYEVLGEIDRQYKIMDDDGDEWWYRRRFFIPCPAPANHLCPTCNEKLNEED